MPKLPASGTVPPTSQAQFVHRDLYRTLARARDYGEIWWVLDGKHSERDKIIQASERYSGFFEPLLPGMFVAFITVLSSLFDEQPDCVTLKGIPELAADPTFVLLWSNGRRLYKYRSKVIAHRDVHNDSVDFAAATGFTYNDIRGILNEACGLYDRYAMARNLATLPSPQPSPGKDLLRIVRKLSE
jgi:hypothetical protein